MTARIVTDASFAEDVLGRAGPVLVDFWAEWCGPCRMMSTMVDDIAAAHAAKLSVVKVNIDQNPLIAANYNVRSVPSFLVFIDGAVSKSFSGPRTKAAFLRDLSDYI